MHALVEREIASYLPTARVPPLVGLPSQPRKRRVVLHHAMRPALSAPVVLTYPQPMLLETTARNADKGHVERPLRMVLSFHAGSVSDHRRWSTRAENGVNERKPVPHLMRILLMECLNRTCAAETDPLRIEAFMAFLPCLLPIFLDYAATAAVDGDKPDGAERNTSGLRGTRTWSPSWYFVHYSRRLQQTSVKMKPNHSVTRVAQSTMAVFP